MDISSLYKIFTQHPAVTTDSRDVTPGAIFFALKGINFDGNEYASEALAAGCSYAVVDNPRYATSPNTILVESSLKTLQELANYHRRKMRTPIIAITGTNGKTTTKELVYSVLSQEHNAIAPEENINYAIGVPLTLLRLRKEHEIAVIEINAGKIGGIKELCEIAEPDYGLITNISPSHTEKFGSLQNLINSKKELYTYIASRKEGKIFVNYDNPALREMAVGIPSIYYGLDSDHDQFVTGKVVSSTPYLVFEWKMARKFHTVKTKMIGDYNLSNALAAITIGKYFGVKGEKICHAIEAYEPDKRRTHLKETKKNMLLIDAYNANPASMQAALQNFGQMEVNNKVLILGEMKELGPDSNNEHQRIVDNISQYDFDKVILVGENFNQLSPKYETFSEVEDLMDYLKKQPLKNNYILLKGARRLHLENIIELL